MMLMCQLCNLPPPEKNASALTHTHHEEAIPCYSKYGCIFRDAKLPWLYGSNAKLAKKIERASGHASPLFNLSQVTSVILFQLKKVSGCLVVVMLMVMQQQKSFQLEAVKNLPDIKPHKCTSTKALHQGDHRKCIYVILIDECVNNK